MHAFCDVKIPDPQPLLSVKSFYNKRSDQWESATWRGRQLRKGPGVKSRSFWSLSVEQWDPLREMKGDT
ncbi:hypothetical protein VNO78_30465 [Psophocarpus tetragonolobus]|uniref:Uncharacterized protein n=1 Tax=Psophocarpus tetragonolobus TaxID=3891 RepID=A0AAN9X722_PSOTE